MSSGALNRRSREAREWLLDACFPLWSERGTRGFGFVEALDLLHRPIESDQARVRVQARQTYVFTAAMSLGWSPDRAMDLIYTGLKVLGQSCRRPDGVFGRDLNLTTGRLMDDTADLYDTAFGLFASANVYQVSVRTGQQQAIRDSKALFNETVEALDGPLKHPAGGYFESLPRPEYRMQNPHMHLFEASLALAEATREAAYMDLAKTLMAFCLERFIDAETGTLGEYFSSDTWKTPPNALGRIIEPGHQFEWVWLMTEYARIVGKPLPDEARILYHFACKTLDDGGRAIQTCLRDGTPVDASRRTWTQTEALKAHLAMVRAGEDTASARAVASFDVLMDEYLTPEGGWIDHYSEAGEILAQTIPASTGYHVVLAMMDLIRTTEA